MDIAIDLQGDVALFTMDDGKKNAIDLQAPADLNVALDKAEADGRLGEVSPVFSSRSDKQSLCQVGR